MARSLKKGPFVDDHLRVKVEDLNSRNEKKVLNEALLHNIRAFFKNALSERLAAASVNSRTQLSSVVLVTKGGCKLSKLFIWMAEASQKRWLADHLSGKASVLLAPTSVQAADLARRARDQLAAFGLVAAGDLAELADGNEAGVGDLVVARRNARVRRSIGAVTSCSSAPSLPTKASCFPTKGSWPLVITR